MSRPDEKAPPRLALIAHLREQIERDAESYANESKLRIALERMDEEESK